jgi:hypothetical protein
MKFIRCLWGNLNDNNIIKEEILYSNKYIKKLNEIVYVWGIDNEKFLKYLGYNTKLLSINESEYGSHFYYNYDTFFLHKLIALQHAIHDYNEIVFLDWDLRQIHDIDDYFLHLLRTKNSNLQIPLYSYPNNYLDIIKNNNNNHYIEKFAEIQHRNMVNNNYKFENDFVFPNTGFVYCNDFNVVDELIKIHNILDGQVLTDEISVLIYSKKFCNSLDDYINKFEPLVCYGKRNSSFNQKKLNDYIDSILNKKIYFIHY